MLDVHPCEGTTFAYEKKQITTERTTLRSSASHRCFDAATTIAEQQYRNMRSWSPKGRRGLEKRSSVDGFVYRGRFRIRDVSFSENDEAPPSVGSAAASVLSAPAAAGRRATLPPPLPAAAAAAASVDPAGKTTSSLTLTSAALAAEGRAPSFLDRRSDVSDYSYCAAVSEFSEHDDTGRRYVAAGDGHRESEESRGGRRGRSERAASYRRGGGGGGGASYGGRGDRGMFMNPSVGETSETSGGYDSELNRNVSVRPTPVSKRIVGDDGDV